MGFVRRIQIRERLRQSAQDMIARPREIVAKRGLGVVDRQRRRIGDGRLEQLLVPGAGYPVDLQSVVDGLPARAKQLLLQRAFVQPGLRHNRIVEGALYRSGHRDPVVRGVESCDLVR